MTARTAADAGRAAGRWVRPGALAAAVAGCWLGGLAALPRSAAAQQPFVTDDAAVTAEGTWHFEFSDELDRLQPSARPARWQNTASFELAYGAGGRLETALEAPLITIESERAGHEGGSDRVFGPGDVNLGFKYLLREERPTSRWPALAASLGFEIPTGDVERQLGSGVEDYSLNGIVQKTLRGGALLRGNLGAVLSGNTVTGALGLRTRGLVWTGGVSLTRAVGPRLNVGAELSGATSRHQELGQRALQALAGGNWALREGLTLDFAVLGGRYAATPRYGVQLGFSADF
jgi:hypothetical protein